MADPRLEIAAERRRTILSLLLQKPMTSRDIAEITGIDRSTVTSHVKRLAKSGLLEKLGSQRAPLYRLVSGAMPSSYQVPLDVLASEMAKTGLCGEMK